MSIQDLKHMGLFRVDFMRYVLDLDHKAIADYTLEHSKGWNSYTNYHDKSLCKDWQNGIPGKDKFEATLREAADAFVERTKRRKFTEDTGGHYLWYWASVYRKHDQHGSHNHPMSLLAGSYYPKTGADSSPIILEAPWDNVIMHDTLTHKDSEQIFRLKPNPGDMYIWPSWLKHRVPPQKTDEPRIAISFNFDYGRYHSDD
tara:strand:- start:995 stop:1597 length:603 start_codon:yes stop_codon:yes gene_type:complete